MLYGPHESQVKKRSARRTAAGLLLRRPARREIKARRGAKDGADAMFTLDELAQTIDQRAGTSAETSYTRSLIDKGAAHCARKFGEEAIEFAIAAAALDESAVRAEAADVLYHLLVVLRVRGVALSSVMDELGKRSKQSGHQEKASRTK
jgi:phosphoribosyl-ATP pyrophosphohydrolase